MEDQTRSLSEVAGLMGTSERTVRRWIKSGRLKAYKPGRDYRIPETALQRFIAESEVSPKGSAPLFPEPSFNDLLEEERREEIYGPWLDLANRYAARWEQRIEKGEIDHGAVKELLGFLEDIGPTLRALDAKERQELPRDQWGAAYENLKINSAVGRLTGFFTPLMEAGHSMFENSDLEQLRRKRKQLTKEGPGAGREAG